MQKRWLIKDLLGWTTRYFVEKGIEEARLEAEVLLARVLEKDRVYLYTNYEAPVNQDERAAFRECIKRRVKGEPLAYILGSKEFMSLEFQLSPAVLIPRPETELLVETALELAKEKNNVRICDVGTGSGAIAVSLAFYIPGCQVYATDLSAQALEIARENARRHGVEIYFSQGDLLSPLMDEEKFDIITANLPYIPYSEYRKLDPGIVNYEPEGALLASGDGLDIYRRLLPQSLIMLRSGGYLLIEIGSNQGEQALTMSQEFNKIEIIKDLAGKNRLLKLRRE